MATIAIGLLPEDDAPGEGGVLSEAASHAIEALLEQNLVATGSDGPVPAPPCGASIVYVTGSRSIRAISSSPLPRASTWSRCAIVQKPHYSTCAADGSVL